MKRDIRSALEQLAIWMQAAKLSNSTASALLKQYNASQKKVESLSKQNTKLQQAKDKAESQLSKYNLALVETQQYVLPRVLPNEPFAFNSRYRSCHWRRRSTN